MRATLRRAGLFVMLWMSLVKAATAVAEDWPQWRGPQRDGVYREEGILERLPPELEFRWRTPIGAGYAGPAVAGGRVFVPDRILAGGESNPENPFARDAVRGSERLLCLDAADGKLIWKLEYPCRYTLSYPSGPRVTPTVHDGKVYAVGAMGHFFCLAADDGEILWSRNYSHDYGWRPNTWGVSAAPLVDSEKVILLVGGADGAGVVALERNTGKEIWRALELDDPGYCPPVIIEAGGTRQLIQWTPKFLASLDIESGAVHWREPFDVQSSLTVPTPIFDAATHRLFVTSFYNGPMMLELDRERPAAKVLWRGKSQSEQNTDILHSIISTPVLTESHIYGVDSYGMLRCIEAKSGRRVWESLEATGEDRWWTAFLIPHGDRYLVANEQGELITVRLTPEGYEETSRAQLIEPTNPVRRRKVVWSHPAFANRSVYARNDREIVCASLAAGE